MSYEEKLIDLLKEFSLNELQEACNSLSLNYLERKWKTSFRQKLAYILCRLPATMAVLEGLHLDFGSILDLGAGPGMAALLFPNKVTSVEKDPDFIALGQKLGVVSSWILGDFQTLSLSPHEAVLFSYSLGEVSPLSLEKYWNLATHSLIIIEPGTPRGYEIILDARKQLLSLGGFITAPCPHAFTCPLSPPDWCHFGKTLPRSRLHRMLKEASLHYEEEKFSYLIVSKTPPSPPTARILARPAKHKGHLRLKLCTPEGTLQYKTLSKSEGPLYKLAKKKSWGDRL